MTYSRHGRRCNNAPGRTHGDCVQRDSLARGEPGSLVTTREIFEQEAEFFATNIRHFSPQVTVQETRGKTLVGLDGVSRLDFTTLDPLAVGTSTRARLFATYAAWTCGTMSAGAAQAVQRTTAMQELEDGLAAMHGMDTSILMMNAYMVNSHLLPALAYGLNNPVMTPHMKDQGVAVPTWPVHFFASRKTHASMHHGIEEVQEKHLAFFRDAGELRGKMERARQKTGDDIKFVVVTDAMDSVTGEALDLRDICRAVVDLGAFLWVDEAHSVGVYGPDGNGLMAEYLLELDPEVADSVRHHSVIMGTLMKAFAGQAGGYACLNHPDMKEMWSWASRCYVFSNPLTPPELHYANLVLKHAIHSRFGDRMRARLHENSVFLRRELEALGFSTFEIDNWSHIVSVRVGSTEQLNVVGERLYVDGVMAAKFDRPAVSKGSECIRFSVRADFTQDDLGRVIESMKKLRDHGMQPA